MGMQENLTGIDKPSKAPEDFTEVFQGYYGRLLTCACGLRGNYHDAEDLTIEALEKAYSSWENFDPKKGTLTSWLFTILRNLNIDKYRGSKRKRTISLEAADGLAADPFSDLPDPIRQKLTRDAIAQLPRTQREAVVLNYGYELTHQEIADLKGIKLGTVKTRIRTAKDKLRQNPKIIASR